MPKDYKDQFTLDGRVKPANHMVTRQKVEAADLLVKDALQGSKIAAGKLAEVMTSSDLKFNIAHLVTVNTLPQFDDLERTWQQIAGTRTVQDFTPTRMVSTFGELTGAGVATGGGLPVVPEGAPYPYVTITGQESFYAKIQKMGAKFGFTWETSVNDIIGFLQDMPQELLGLVVDTEEREVYDALKSASNSLAGGTLPDSTVVPTNAPVSANAIAQAIYELETTEVNGKAVGPSSTGYNVIVPIGRKRFLDYELSQSLITVQDGNLSFTGGNRDWLGSYDVIETPEVTGTNWYILPKPGGLRRPVLELGRLTGYENPELRVNNDTGTYVGGSAVSPFEGSFDNDTVDYRVRYVCGGILWDDTYILKSDGTGS